MNDDLKKKTEPIKMPQKIGLIVAGLFLLYVIVGFWVAPPLLKPKLEDQLSRLIGRKVTIAGIKLNPLVLSATISTLTVHEIDGQPFAGFETLYANAQVSSILKWAATVSEIRVEGPFGVLKLLPDNKLNVDDILTKLSEPKTKPEEKEDAGLPRAIIEKFQVSDGHAVVENLSGKEPIREELSPISFTIDNLSTLEGRQGEYRFMGVGPLDGQFEVDGKITVNPFRVQGSYAINDTRISHYWEHFKDLVSFQIISGTTDLSGDYTVEVVDGQLNARLEDGTFELDDFKLVEKGKEEVLIALPTFSIKGIGADLQAREVNVELVETLNGRIHSWLSPEGTFELQRLLLSDLEKWSKIEKAAAPEPEPVPIQPWHVALKKMEVKDWGLGVEDQTLAHPAKLTVGNIDMVVENLTNAKGKTATLGLSMRFNQAGDVTIKGTAGMVPLQADLNVVTTKISLKSFQPYVDEAVNAQIDSGTTSSEGRLRYRGEDSQPQIRYEGDLSVNDVGIKDRLHIEDFITLAQLKAEGIGLELRPNQLTVAQILIDRPSALVTVDEAGVVNVVNAFTPVENATSDKEGTDNLLKRLVDFFLVEFKGPMPMSVDRVELKAFSGDFVDASISPSYETQVAVAGAAVTGLSSDPSAKADFKFNGKIDGKGRLEGSGQMNPMNALKYSKLGVSLKDFALPPVSPYSGKFIGYKIDQGTLHVDLKYQVANDSIDGSNIIVVDQLELGEPVDSPDAIDLPIKLGLAMLKDSEGRINVRVPVEGNVKDPHFDFAKAIGRALTGTIKDASSAPFAAITEVDGFKGEELSTVAFEFGFSELQDREIQKLNALAKFLKKKKTLTLEIAGMADQQMDGAVLLETSRDESQPDEDQGAETEVPEEPAVGQFVDNERLEQLARMRAEQVRTYLIEKANLEARRIQLKPFQINPAPSGDGGLVELSLSVE